MPLSEVVLIALLGSLSGLMIGCIGIGGVILVPALIFLAGITIQIAIPAAMFAYILSGLVATLVFARNKSIDWRMASSLCLGGTSLSGGSWFGAKLAAPRAALRRVVSSALVVIGLFILANVGWRLIG